MIYNHHYLDKKSIPYFEERIVDHYGKQPAYREMMVVCLGSVRNAHDSLGPKIGSRLAERITGDPRVEVFGTVEKPVHSLNYHKTLNRFLDQQRDTYVIAIDACMGQLLKVGTLQLVEAPLQPGSAFGASLPPIGHISFKGIVNNCDRLRPEVLDHPSLRFLDEMALVMSRVIVRAVQRIVPLLMPYGTEDSGTTRSYVTK